MNHLWRQIILDTELRAKMPWPRQNGSRIKDNQIRVKWNVKILGAEWMSGNEQIPNKVDKHRNLIMQIVPIRQGLSVGCVFFAINV